MTATWPAANTAPAAWPSPDDPQRNRAHFAASAAGSGPGPLAGCKVLVTAGPTREAYRSGALYCQPLVGPAGLRHCRRGRPPRGRRPYLISGPVELQPRTGKLVAVESAREMLKATLAALPADIAVFTAAVADWHVEAASEKIKKRGGPPP
jgi:phosphopantothenoylcysteine decarboxylase / phosphopantothenate---cysteine ligase